MKPSNDLGPCVICGNNQATTMDHIPPKGVFCKPRPNNLIRVPACQECNNSVSHLDERFRVYLGLHVERRGGNAGQAFYKDALRTIEHNSKLRREILSKLEPVYLTTESGIIYDRGFRVQWDSQAHDAIVRKMITGLYYHHFGEILGNRADIEVHWYRKLTPEMLEMSKTWHLGKFGTGEVAYRYARARSSPRDSVWIFQFYKAHWAGGRTRERHPEPKYVAATDVAGS